MSENSDSQPDFGKGDGLLPAIAQDAETGEVLMMAYMNEGASARYFLLQLKSFGARRASYNV